MNRSVTSPLGIEAARLLGLGRSASATVSSLRLTGVSQVELQGDHVGEYVSAFERFVRAVVLGYRGIVAVDLQGTTSGLQAHLLVVHVGDADREPSWSPESQLDRIRIQVARSIEFDVEDPSEHLDAVQALRDGMAIEPAVEEVAHKGLLAQAVLPVELTPSGIGTLAQVLEGLRLDCSVRFIIAPLSKPRPKTSLLMDQLANVDRLCTDSEVPRAVAYRARAVRSALQRMLNCWLGQACVLQIQLRSERSDQTAGIVQLLREEIARPKFDELAALRGARSYLVAENGDEPPTLSALPNTTPLSMAALSSIPVPSFWVDGTGERPKDLTPIDTTALLAVPPLPAYCDLTSIKSVVVERRPTGRPERWIADTTPVGRDSVGNEISLDETALSRHVHLIGVPGCGKTSLMYQMAAADLQAARGFLVLDPHGDLAKRVALKASWSQDGVMGNVEFPGLRLLSSSAQGVDSVERDVGAIIEAVESALPREFTGPVFRQLARGCLTLHAYVGAGQPVADAVKYVREDLDSLDRVLRKYRGPDWVKKYLLNAHAQLATTRAQDVDWFESKFTDYLRTGGATRLFAPVGQGWTAQQIVDGKSQMVIDFAELGSSTYDAGLLGQLFVTSFLRNLVSGGPNLKRRFFLYLDEVQLFFGPAVERALQEGRKYGLSVIAAHQNSSQLSQERFDSLVGQVGLEMVFRCSLRDSQLLSQRLDLSSESLTSLPDMACWVAGGIVVDRGGSFLLNVERPDIWTT